jgi:hypothetical protein
MVTELVFTSGIWLMQIAPGSNVKSETSDPREPSGQLLWKELPYETRAVLTGKLAGLWGAPSDQEAFESLSEDKQQALLLTVNRLVAKNLWDAVKRINNVYGQNGVGIDFTAWPFLENALSRRRDFTRRFAKRRSVKGGFYETGRREAVLHFLYQEGNPRGWHVHFDLYSPVQCFSSILRHIRYEYVGKLTPDWRMIRKSLNRD